MTPLPRTAAGDMPPPRSSAAGFTLIELMVAMSIGLVLIGGALYVYAQSSSSYRAADSISRLQETARFALDTLEPDLRLAGFWGLNSGPVEVPGDIVVRCTGTGAVVTDWALDVAAAVEARDDAFDLPCPAFRNDPQPGSDVLILRHAAPPGPAPTLPEADRVQLQANLQGGRLFADGLPPDLGADSRTFDVVVSAYYISRQSSFDPTRPSLRRLTLRPNRVIGEEEVIPGVENLQVQFGVDTTGDGSVNRYVDPDHPLLTPGAPGFVPGARTVAVRLWMLVAEPADDPAWRDERSYPTPDRDLGDIVPGGDYPAGSRRLPVSKTILLRNLEG